MESFLIASKNKKQREDYSLTVCQEWRIDPLDINVSELTGIAQVRDLQKTLFFAPLRGKTKAIVIKNAEKLTVEAQNALLKVLEEPPSSTIIILTAENKEFLLQTILSRCKIIELQNGSSLMANHQSLVFGGVGDRLKLAESLAKNKEDAIVWLENAILSLRQELINGKQRSHTIRSFQETYIILKTTNANPRLTLENLFLNL